MITLLKHKRSLINNLCFQRTDGLFLVSLLSKKDQPFEYCLCIFYFTYFSNFVNFLFAFLFAYKYIFILALRHFGNNSLKLPLMLNSIILEFYILITI